MANHFIVFLFLQFYEMTFFGLRHSGVMGRALDL